MPLQMSYSRNTIGFSDASPMPLLLSALSEPDIDLCHRGLTQSAGPVVVGPVS